MDRERLGLSRSTPIAPERLRTPIRLGDPLLIDGVGGASSTTTAGQGGKMRRQLGLADHSARRGEGRNLFGISGSRIKARAEVQMSDVSELAKFSKALSRALDASSAFKVVEHRSRELFDHILFTALASTTTPGS